MVTVRQMGDQCCLSHPPCPVDAVRWSEDNLIAVAAAHTVVIISPADITGPRAYAVIETINSPPVLGCKPGSYEDSVPLGIACMAEAGAPSSNPATVRALCWSPAGCTSTGACLLTVITSNGKVQLFQPPSGLLASRWRLAVDLSQQLQQHMTATDWQDADHIAADCAKVATNGVLRLRGGGSAGKGRSKQQREQQTQDAGLAQQQEAAGAAPQATAAAAAAEVGRKKPEQAAAAFKQEPPAKRQKVGSEQQQPPSPASNSHMPNNATIAQQQAAGLAEPPKRKRGRPPKLKPAEQQQVEQAKTQLVASLQQQPAASQEPLKRRRGRPAKARPPPAAELNLANRNSKVAGAVTNQTAAPAAESTADIAASPASGRKAAGKPKQQPSPRKQPPTPATTAATPADSAAAVADLNAHLPRTDAVAFSVGCDVEVMNDEDGLRGAWWAGRITAMQHGYALVEYAALFNDEAGTTPLREWFVVPGLGAAADPTAGQAVAQGYVMHLGQNYQMRPKPPQELLTLARRPAPGDSVEIFVDDGWWRTRVISATASQLTAPVAHVTHIVSVPLEGCVRALTVWEPDTAIWDLGILVDPAAAQQQQQQPSPTKAGVRDMRAAAAVTAANGKQLAAAAHEGPTVFHPAPAPAQDEGDKQQAVVVTEISPAAHADAPGRRKRSSTAQKSKGWTDEFISAELALGDSSSDKGLQAAAGRARNKPKPHKHRGSDDDSASDWAADGSGGEESDDYDLSSDVEESEEQPTPEQEDESVSEDDEQPARASGKKQQIPDQAAAAVTSPRMQIRKVPKTMQHSSSAAHGAAAGAAQASTMGLGNLAAAAAAAVPGPFNALVRVSSAAAKEKDGGQHDPLVAPLSRQQKVKGTKELQRRESSAADDIDAHERAGDATEDEEGDPEAEYQVPIDLPQDTFTTLLPSKTNNLDGAKTWKTAIPRALQERFSQLRASADPKKLPCYSKGQHLRKADLRLWTQVWAEFTALHGQELEQQSFMTAKQLISSAKSLIRKVVIQSLNPYIRSDASQPYLTKGYMNRGPGSSATTDQTAGSEGKAIAGSGQRLRDLMVSAAMGQQQEATAPVAVARKKSVAKRSYVFRTAFGPLNLVAGECVDNGVRLNSQAPGVEVQLAARATAGPSLHVRMETAVAVRQRANTSQAAAAAVEASTLAALAGPQVPLVNWEARRTFMAATAAAWSNTCLVSGTSSRDQTEQQQQPATAAAGTKRVALLAVGSKAGCCQLWRYTLPEDYSSNNSSNTMMALDAMQYIGVDRVTSGAYVTAMSWAVIPAAAAAGANKAGRGSSSGACCMLPGSVVWQDAGDVLLLAIGTSAGEVSLWLADPAAADATAALTRIGTALLRDQQAVLVLDVAVLVAAVVKPLEGSKSSTEGWQLLLAAGKTLGTVSAWHSGVLPAAGGKGRLTQQQLAIAVAAGSSNSTRAHGFGFVTGVQWNGWEQQPSLSTSGADGRLVTWTWSSADGLQPARTPSRFNRQWLRPAAASAMPPSWRATAPVTGLAASGSRLMLAAARDWHVVMAAGELEAAGTGAKANTSVWARTMHGALQLYTIFGPRDAALLQQLLCVRLLPQLMWQGSLQPVLPAAAMWDVAAAVARCGWQSLSNRSKLLGGNDSTAAAAAASQQRQVVQCNNPGSDQGQPTAAGNKPTRYSTTGLARSGSSTASQAQGAGQSNMAQTLQQRHSRECALQLDLLQQLLQVLTCPFTNASSQGAQAAASGNHADAAAVTTNDKLTSETAAVPAYRPEIPAEAWRGLQFACYLLRSLLQLWEGCKITVIQKLQGGEQKVTQLQQQLHQWEFELVQQHVFHSLTKGVGYCLEPRAAEQLAALQQQLIMQQQHLQQLQLPKLAGTAPAAVVSAGNGDGVLGMYPLSEVLMADWVSLNIRHPDLHGDKLLPAAAAVYAQHGLQPPLTEQGSTPARELNPLDANGFQGLPAVGLNGEGVSAATWATIYLQNPEPEPALGGENSQDAAAAAKWPRCAATLMLCGTSSSNSLGSSSWGCSSCSRRYLVPPCYGVSLTASDQPEPGLQETDSKLHCLVEQPSVPVCLVCGCRLSIAGAAAAGMAGAGLGGKHALHGSPVLAVGMSLPDMPLVSHGA